MNNEILEKLDNLEKQFELISNKENKILMENYLKNNFSFYGIRKPNLKIESKEFVDFTKTISKDELEKLIKLILTKKEREWIYVSTFILEKNINRLNEVKDVYFIKSLILINPWWDSVDTFSGLILSKILLKYFDSNFIEKFTKEMIKDDDIWMKRASLLCQLKFKSKTNFELQKDLILSVYEINSFWIQKAIGWTLREYSGTNPNEVMKFVKSNEEIFSNLVKKEALRKII